ncbi:MAG: transporter substrate-binding domain-containing protein [Hylemonella sp.]|nr:transporter substrate-binding domain-containing protein [Hylemonella sp.]
MNMSGICLLRGRFSSLRIVLLLALFSIVSPAEAAVKLVFSFTLQPPYTTQEKSGFTDLLMPLVFREAGIDAEVFVYQGAFERQLANADAGIEDGMGARVAGLEKQYPNLVRVPEELVTFDFVAFSIRHRFPTANWESLSPYAVSYIIGWKAFEANVSGVKELALASNVDQLFTLLEMGRTDVVLYERLHGLIKAREKGLIVQTMEPPLLRSKLYIYVHRKHAALAPRLAEALRRLKQDGTYQRIYSATLGTRMN